MFIVEIKGHSVATSLDIFLIMFVSVHGAVRLCESI